MDRTHRKRAQSRAIKTRDTKNGEKERHVQKLLKAAASYDIATQHNTFALLLQSHKLNVSMSARVKF